MSHHEKKPKKPKKSDPATVEKPYSGPDDPKLPSNVKKLPAKKRRQWVAVWNSVYRKCRSKGGAKKTCEARAFRQANGVVRRSLIRGVTKILIEIQRTLS